jgi:hypothetical protein
MVIPQHGAVIPVPASKLSLTPLNLMSALPVEEKGLTNDIPVSPLGVPN